MVFIVGRWFLANPGQFNDIWHALNPERSAGFSSPKRIQAVSAGCVRGGKDFGANINLISSEQHCAGGDWGQEETVKQPDWHFPGRENLKEEVLTTGQIFRTIYVI